MALDPYSSVVVVCLVFIWIVLGLMFMKEYWPCIVTQTLGILIPKGEVLPEVVGSTHDTSSSSFIIPGNGSDVIITVDPPSHEADTANGGSQANRNGAPEGEGSSSRGSTDGSHSDMSIIHSLHSNDTAHRRTSANGHSLGQSSNEGPNAAMSGFHSLHSYDQPKKRTTASDKSVGQSSNEGSNAAMSECHSLHSNDQPQKRTTASDQSVGQSSNEGPNAAMSECHSLHSNDQPHKRTTASDQSVGQNSNEGPNTDMSGCHSLHSNDQPQKNWSPFLEVGQPLSEVGGSSEISSWHSLRSTESPQRRPLQDDVGVSPSLPALILYSISEKDHSEAITKRQRKKMHTV